MSEHISIFCATDENYAPFASLMMLSVLMHTDSFIDFYIMDGGIKEKTKKLIDEDLKAYSNKTLNYIDMTKYDLTRFPDISYYSINMYSRYFIPDIAPNLRKAIYLDVDIIVKGDIAKLYGQDMENYSIGAIPESEFTKRSFIRVKREVCPSYNGSAYFNSGVLLMDISNLKAMDFVKKAVDLTAKFSRNLSCPDQDVLNILFENNYKQLDYVFNFMPHFEKKHAENWYSHE